MTELADSDLCKPPLNKKKILLELAVVLLIFYVPSLWSAIGSVLSKGDSFNSEPSFGTGMFLMISKIAMIAYLIGYSEGGFKRFGFRPVKLSHLVLTVGLFLTAAMIHIFSATSFRLLVPDIWRPPIHPSFNQEMTVACVCILTPINAAYQEILMRSYLITQMMSLWRSPWVAILLSSLLFSSWHIYAGARLVVSTAIVGVLYACVFLRYKTIWPIIGAHGLYNLAAHYGLLTPIYQWLLAHLGIIH